MPETITVYNDFVPGNKARANEVDQNFANHRGTLIPIDPNTASAAGDTYNVGSSEHRWVNYFGHKANLKQTAAGAEIDLVPNPNTTSTFDILLNSATAASLDANGWDGGFIQSGTVPRGALTSTAYTRAKTQVFTANGSFTIPSNVGWVLISGMGGGGGGGGGQGGDNGSGGGGGAGCSMIHIGAEVTAGNVLSITVGSGGSGGQGDSLGGSVIAGSSGTSSQVLNTDRYARITFFGADGGDAGANDVSANGGAGTFNVDVRHISGGNGGANDSDGSNGSDHSLYNQSGGSGGTNSNGGGGGGGGASSIANGGGGGNSASNSADNGSNGGTGAGGGGGGGAGSGGQHGDGGNGGGGIVIVQYADKG